ncbi:MAG: hypothetical protein ABIH11_06830 [Candidatus Altiarchaeota archaeon]
MDLYYDRESGNYVIKDGSNVIILSEKDFDDMKRDGRSPLLKKLWDSAKKQKNQPNP